MTTTEMLRRLHAGAQRKSLVRLICDGCAHAWVTVIESADMRRNDHACPECGQTKAMPACCRTCMFGDLEEPYRWERRTAKEAGEEWDGNVFFVECHRRAPKSSDGDYGRDFPWCAHFDWCGDWQHGQRLRLDRFGRAARGYEFPGDYAEEE